MTNTKKTIALISGANQGIGLAVAAQLAKDHGYHVIIGSRNASAGEQAVATIASEGVSISTVQLDLASDDSISAAVKSIEQQFGVLDVLVNNAGVLLDLDKTLSTRDLFSQTLETNVIGTACLTEACLPLLKKSELPRVVFVSSRMGSVTCSLDKSTLYYETDYKAYDSSKAAVNMLASNYARILEGSGGLVNVACPGLIKTKLTGYHAYGGTTEEGAKRIVELATLEKGGQTGTFSDRGGEVPW
ncbi:short chain dehydrogenase [Aaosphaeria arxii CBS 175.79]|uniref:Short chain dehydrogenase n=1 Tax=Aaosphaeria arxii CBS 175.79 TaxID=1450172 RepID=A0A6A5Y5H4_9PLEO|nr:short chain dehydrogenase [Aaosphaeria arxii CBS 175.79]KAF2020805.1 short chain dehydrogenase [Aaosphaeria arxii CBS 175.79]